MRLKRSQSVLLLLGASTALSVLLLALVPAGAQEAGMATAAQTPAEAEALELFAQEKMIKARTKAEEVLEANPNSLVGHYVLGCVLHEAEGSLARAMYHLGRARELYETTWHPSTRPAGAPWELHREILYHIQGLAGEMELYEYQLEILGYHDYLYDPDLLGESAWPLLHLERYDEAREMATIATKVRNDEWQRSLGLNALCAIEGEAGTRQPCVDACIAALENARRRRAVGGEEAESVALTVHAYNAAQAARAMLDFERAEQLSLEGARRLEHTPANPWRLLALQYLDQARMTDAVSALREMHRWRKRQPAFLRDQDRAETDAAFATVLLVAGETDVGLGAIDRALAQPDRRGLSSSGAEQALGSHALLRRALRLTAGERAAEKSSYGGFFGQLRGRGGRSSDALAAWPDGERVVSVMADDRRLVRTFRLYVAGGLSVPTWLVGDLVDVLGAGVVAVAVREARAEEGPSSPLVPYYDALEAEVALAQGDDDKALNMAKAALERLPTVEALLRARIAIVAARAAEETGRAREALSFYEDAMQVDGGVIRRMQLSIPARVRASGDGIAARAADMIGRSPRFDDEPGFEVRVTTQATGELEACLVFPSGARTRCAQLDPDALAEEYEAALTAWEERQRGGGEADPAADGDEAEAEAETETPRDDPRPERPDPAVELATRFHDEVFSAAVRLSSADLGSLDGRTTTGSEVAREQMRDLLDQAIQGGN